jgi:predicted DNA-binding transcriptional regulator
MGTRYAESTSSPLEIFGIGHDEERAYRALLVVGTATAEEVARKMALPPRKAQQLLDAIEARGLATHSPERPRRYIAASPETAIEALAHQHQRSVQRARGMIEELQQHAVAGRKETQEQQEQLIEVISTPDVGRLVYKQIYQSAEIELLGLSRLPILYTVLSSPPDSSAQQELQSRGVRHRSISDVEMVSLPGMPERMRADFEAGEEARLMASVPFKMVLVDRRVGLLLPNHASGPSLVVRYSPLLDALYALFEIFWERASPTTFSSAGKPNIGDAAPGLSAELEQLLPLLTAGLNDKSIAHQLDISERTVARRVVELLEFLGARTRLQAGWLAAMRSKSLGSTPRERPKSRRRR